MWTILFFYLRKINSKWQVVYILVVCVFFDQINFIRCELASSLDVREASTTTAFVNVTYVDPLSGKLHTERAQIGRFGTLEVDNRHGLVRLVRNPRDGSACDFSSETDSPTEAWIALLKHGVCPLKKKIEYSLKSNASAVVVYHKEDDDELRGMTVQNLIAISITHEKGEEIASLVENGTQVHMYITIGYRQSRHNINRTSVLFVSVSFIVLMIISLAWLVFYYVQRFRYIHAKDQLARRLCNAAKKALAKIPEKNIKEMEGEHGCCAVCIEYYEPSDIVRTLPCKHIFHKKCVDPWLLDQRTCPMCKMDILEYYGLMFTSQESELHIEIEEPIASSMEEGSVGVIISQETSSVRIEPNNSCVEAYVEANDFSDVEDEQMLRQPSLDVNEMDVQNANMTEEVKETTR